MELQALAEHETRDVLLLFEKGLKKEDITSYFAGTVEAQGRSVGVGRVCPG